MSLPKLDRRILRAMDRRIDKQLSRLRRGLRSLDFRIIQKHAERRRADAFSGLKRKVMGEIQ